MKISQKRRKVGYTYSSVSGSYSFRKTKSIDFESTLERDLLVLLEYDSTVEDVIEQPVTIEYVNHNGRAASYTPDFLVHYSVKNGNKSDRCSKLIEVKPSRFLEKDWGDLKKKFKVGVACAKDKGWVFKIYNESRIRTQRFRNIRKLEGFRNLYMQKDGLEFYINQVMHVDGVSIGRLVSHLNSIKGKDTNSLSLVWHLIYIKFLRCDLSKLLDLETKVWLGNNQDRSLFYG